MKISARAKRLIKNIERDMARLEQELGQEPSRPVTAGDEEILDLTMEAFHQRHLKRRRIWSYYLNAEPSELGVPSSDSERVSHMTVCEFVEGVRYGLEFNVRGWSVRSQDQIRDELKKHGIDWN